MGEVKHAEMHSPDTGIVRFAAEKDAELAISKWSLAVDFSVSLAHVADCSCACLSLAEIMDGARFDNQTVYVSFF